MQRPHRGKRVVGLRRHRRDRRVVAGGIGDGQIGGEPGLDFSDRGQVGVEALAVAGAKTTGHAAELASDGIQNRLPARTGRRASAAGSVCRSVNTLPYTSAGSSVGGRG